MMFFDLSSMQPEDIDRAVDAAKDYINKSMAPADMVAIGEPGSGLTHGPGLHRRTRTATAEGCEQVRRHRCARATRRAAKAAGSDGTSDDSSSALLRTTASSTR